MAAFRALRAADAAEAEAEGEAVPPAEPDESENGAVPASGDDTQGGPLAAGGILGDGTEQHPIVLHSGIAGTDGAFASNSSSGRVSDDSEANESTEQAAM